MLKYFYDKGLINYPEKQPKDWEEAVRVSCDKLIEKNLITKDYVDAIVQSVKDNGPYIVIVPGIAMPHAQAENPGVLGTGISFTKYMKPVKFHDENTGEDHYAELFFTLAAKDPDEHLQNIQNLMELLMDEDIVEKLKETNSIEDYKKLL
ncbi:MULTISPECIES: PTS sugar transporter subunit IIA [Aerococcus]|uniref:Ascorbate-specific PTS system EIIA component n=1 Tax=Aerococcus urinae TaxID=1376 RepID=A0A2I1L697_9LACT|nr:MULTISPECIES: PTS sugar transporter subunit IIA [Aerococcus]KAA9219196.1 PTS sugar transporter subunit IIA [Aerococcus loyolae]KAA9266671.1 PTS sugar transporter subunit IIA [Aerococcus loyolae]MCY3067785.1 PTS sugar transporter subunit IIA [Aerococcus mictus]MCY3080315.1 PTS sugar transporter subunit IIA [Aerococcus mictus]MCY3084095.1 PTS sugar transporter subunit IIA [Aerococcus mictus]